MSRAKRRPTRERILDVAVELFNEFGEPSTTTSLIASRMGISPGNLYYHYRNKEDIVRALAEGFAGEMGALLQRSAPANHSVDEIWQQIQDLFSLVWRYRFLYRDLNDILSRNRAVELHFRRIIGSSRSATLHACSRLVAAGEMRATPDEVAALTDNLVVVATYWLSYEYVRNPRQPLGEAALRRGAFQVLAVAAPYLQGRSRALFEKLAEKYLAA